MLATLAHRRNIVALEAFSLSSVSNLVNRIIPGMINDMVNIFSTVNTNEPIVALSGDQKNFVKILNRTNYMDLAPLVIYVPEGMCVSYRDYLEALVDSVSRVELLPEELGTYIAFISRLISNKEDQTSTDYAKHKFQSLSNELVKANETVGHCFKKNSTETEVKASNVVRNNSEFQSVLEQTNLLSERIAKIDRSALQKQIQNASELLTTLERQIKRGEMSDISPEMISKIADYSYVIAQYLEFYSVTYYRIRAFTEAINQSIKKVSEILER